jgi:hypothetical protein
MASHLQEDSRFMAKRIPVHSRERGYWKQKSWLLSGKRILEKSPGHSVVKGYWKKVLATQWQRILETEVLATQ